MTNVLIVMLLLYNMWLVFYLLHEKASGKRTGKSGPLPKPEKPEIDTDIIGKSLFQMPKGRTSGDTAVPQSAISAEGEAVAEDDITFADEMANEAGVPSMRVPDDKLDDTFSDTRLSDLPVEYADGESEDIGEYASGATIEEMNEAIRTADNSEATRTEKQKAGEVFHEMKGNELYDILIAGKPAIKNRIRELIDLYKSKPTVSSGGNNEVLAIGSQNILAVEGLDDFDIRDFV